MPESRDQTDAEYLADVQAIRILTARYNQAVDEGDGESYAGVFTDDGVFESRGSGEPVIRKGREALVAAGNRPPHQQAHATTDAIVEVDGDTATQTCMLLYFGRPANEGDAPRILIAQYRDSLVRTSGGWKFASRVVTSWF